PARHLATRAGPALPRPAQLNQGPAAGRSPRPPRLGHGMFLASRPPIGDCPDQPPAGPLYTRWALGSGSGHPLPRPVAQLVESRSPKPVVGGSSPSWPATPLDDRPAPRREEQAFAMNRETKRAMARQQKR